MLVLRGLVTELIVGLLLLWFNVIYHSIYRGFNHDRFIFWLIGFGDSNPFSVRLDSQLMVVLPTVFNCVMNRYGRIFSTNGTFEIVC